MRLPVFPPKIGSPWVRRFTYVPVSPTGTYLFHLRASSRFDAIQKLMKEGRSVTCEKWEDFKACGYTIKKIEQI